MSAKLAIIGAKKKKSHNISMLEMGLYPSVSLLLFFNDGTLLVNTI